MYNVVSIGSALVDIFIQSDDFEFSQSDGSTMLCQKYGEKLAVDNFEVWPGGGGNNTATGFSRLGFAAAVIAELGKDAFSQVITTALIEERVSTELLITERSEKTGGSVILVGKDGGRTVLTHRGAASQLDVSDIALDSLTHVDWIHLSSVSGRLGVLQHLFGFVKNHQTRLSWNPGKAELQLILDGQLPVPDISAQVLTVNAEEWELVSAQQSALIATIPEIIITDGSRGGSFYVDGKVAPYSATSVTSVDDTGAGDAFVVGYVAGRLWNYSPERSVRLGAANAASAVQIMGATTGLLAKDQLESVS